MLTYTITINNNGASDAAGVVITDTFSADLDFKSISLASPTCTLLVNPGNQVVCTLGQVSAGTSKVVTLALNVKSTATNDPVNRGVVSSTTIDPKTDNNTVQTSTTLDNEPPSITWFAPVFDTLHYWIGNEVVRLMVNTNDNLGIGRVRYYRYDEPTDSPIEIGNKYAPPYDWYLDTQTLNLNWNEIDVEAYDTAGNKSVHHYIFIYKLTYNLLYFPTVLRK